MHFCQYNSGIFRSTASPHQKNIISENKLPIINQNLLLSLKLSVFVNGWISLFIEMRVIAR